MKLVKFLEGDLSQNISFNIEKNSQKSKYFKFFDYIFSSDILYSNFTPYTVKEYLKEKDTLRSLINLKLLDFINYFGIKYSYFTEYFLEVNYIYPTNLLSFFTVKKANILKSNGIYVEEKKLNVRIIRIISYSKDPAVFEYSVIKIINNLKDNIYYFSEDNINKNNINLDISTKINTNIEIDIKSFAKNELVKRIDFSNNSNLVYYNRIKNYININFSETNTYNLKISTNNYSIDINFKIKPYKNLWCSKI